MWAMCRVAPPEAGGRHPRWSEAQVVDIKTGHPRLDSMRSNREEHADTEWLSEHKAERTQDHVQRRRCGRASAHALDREVPTVLVLHQDERTGCAREAPTTGELLIDGEQQIPMPVPEQHGRMGCHEPQLSSPQYASVIGDRLPGPAMQHRLDRGSVRPECRAYDVGCPFRDHERPVVKKTRMKG